MNLIRLSIENPVSTFSAVILVVLFGLLGLARLPVQLTPDVEAPTISINTNWFGASPYEIEKEIIEEQEEVLKSLPSLVTLESSSYNNFGTVNLTFKVGTNLETTMSRVANKLNEVSDYPENADRPVISAAGARSSPIIWMLLKTREDNPGRVGTYRTFFENEVRQVLERVPGVGSLFVFGGTEKRLEIMVEPSRLARYQLTIGELIQRVREANSNISAGVLGLEKRNYRLRTVSQFESPEEVGDVLLKDDGLHRVFLRDVAQARMGYAPNAAPGLHNGAPMIAVGVRKEAGANVLALTRGVRQVVDTLNDGPLAEQGLYIDWAYDQAPYINTAIRTVKINLMIGGALAVTVLLLFLRSISSTLTVAIAIPISVVSTFIFLLAFDRNINVVSLAGISFAVGMLVDNSIVVLENIDRHRRMGKSPYAASYDGTREVWGAVLASTVTTVAVFLPVLFVEEEAGQLFRDIAIAIAFSIVVSLFVSVSVIPAITNLFYGLSRRKVQVPDPQQVRDNWFVRLMMGFSRLTLRNASTRLATVGLFTAASVLTVVALLPKAEYLPQGNRNLILNILVPPPGYSEQKREEIGRYVMDRINPHREQDGLNDVPQILNVFYVSSDQLTLFGGTCVHVTEARKLMPLFREVMNSIPGMFGISIQAGIFSQNIGKGRSVDVNVSGTANEQIVEAAGMLYGAIKKAIPEAQVRPVPSLEISYPEVNLRPHRSRVLANGFSEQELGVYVDVLMDGRKIGEYKPSGTRILDLVVRGGEQSITTPEEILDGIISNPFGQLIRVGDVAELEYSQGLTQIDHLERKRNVRLEVTPPAELPLQTTIEMVENEIIPGLQESGELGNVSVHVGGNADKLTVTREALQWNFLLAIVITYLLMSALFGNYLYPLIILFTVPLAAAGGFIGLHIVDRFLTPQPFDILVMLGFIILVGTVVNNAILIVHQALNNVRHGGLQGTDAVLSSVRTRIRPIFMSTTTSLLGLLPLVLATGAGSELYRGLGSIILGGLAVSTVLTLFVIPALLSFLIGFEKADRQERGTVEPASRTA
jgi:HAE1 family hydrophobic/amphiphilic exporter-1